MNAAHGRRWLFLWILSSALLVAAVVVTARLATFLADETRSELSMQPGDDFYVHHSCLSAYYEAARLARDGARNVYDAAHYNPAQGGRGAIGAFVVDAYQYPPTFLLFPRLGLVASERFELWRPAWFALEGLIVAVALLATALHVGGAAGRAAALLAPLVWLSYPTLLTLQIGNVQIAVIALAVLATIAFERGRDALGGGLLAVAILAKIFPAILVLQLVFEKRWRAVAWTAAAAGLLGAATLAVFGEAPFRAFVTYQLPRLASGEAFASIFAYPDAVACSHAIFAIVQKLGFLGVPGMTLERAAALAALYGLVLVGLAYLTARGGVDRRSRILVALALLQLASLQSPFVPDTYAQFAPLWIVTLLLAGGGPAWRLALLAACVPLLDLMVPGRPPENLSRLAALTLAQQLLFLGLCVGVLWIHGRRRPGQATRVQAGAATGRP